MCGEGTCDAHTHHIPFDIQVLNECLLKILFFCIGSTDIETTEKYYESKGVCVCFIDECEFFLRFLF
jgi:hypothetical protein